MVNEIVTLAHESQLPTTIFTLEYHKKFSLSIKYLYTLIGQLIDYRILDYSCGKLAKSKEKDANKLIVDFLQLIEKQQTNNKIQNNNFSRNNTHRSKIRPPPPSSQSSASYGALNPNETKSINVFSNQQTPLQPGENNTELVEVEKLLRKKYFDFKNKWYRIPNTKELEITSTCIFRKVISSSGGYLNYIFSVEGISEDDLLLEYNQLVEKYGERPPYKLLEQFGMYPVWVYSRCLGNLKMFVKAAQDHKEQKIPSQHSNKAYNLPARNISSLHELAAPKNNEWDRFVTSLGLSVRATNVLINNFCSCKELNTLTKDSLLTLKNCGRKTADELLISIENILGNKENVSKSTLPEQLSNPPDELSLLLLPLFSNKHLHGIGLENLHPGFHAPTRLTDLVLSVRTTNVLNILGLQTVGEVMLTPGADLLKQQNFGKKCLKELKNIIHALCLKGLCGSGNLSIDSLNIDYTSYESMVLSFTQQCIKKECNQKILMRTFCFQEGKVPTLKKLGQHFRISRERIRQILKKETKKIRIKINLDKLNIFWEQLDRVITQGGGIIYLGDLPAALQDEFNWSVTPYSLALGQLLLLRHPNASFKSDEDLFRVESECLSCDRPLLQLQALDFEGTESFHVQVVAAKLSGHCQAMCPLDQKLTTFHRAFIERLVEKSDGRLVLHNDVVLPHGRWSGKYCKNLKDVACHVLGSHGEPMHFREIANGIRQENKKFSEISDQNVHSAIMRYDTIEIIGRGTYGLKSWGMGGYRSVSTAIEDFIDKKGLPQRKQSILQHLEGEFTELNIAAALTKETRFTSIGDGFYDRPQNWQQRSCQEFIQHLPERMAKFTSYLLGRNNTSYKLVMAFIFIRSMDEHGAICLNKLKDMFYNFYLSRHKKGLIVEIDSAVVSCIGELTASEIKNNACKEPLKSFLNSNFFIQFSGNIRKIRLTNALTFELSRVSVRDVILITILKAIDEYFQIIAPASVSYVQDAGNHHEVAEPLPTTGGKESGDQRVEAGNTAITIRIKKKGRSKIRL